VQIPRGRSDHAESSLLAHGAYGAGVPGNGKPFPDGSKIAKIQWIPKKSTEAPFSVDVPDTLKNVFFIEKDSARFPASSGWGYALFNYDAAADAFTPDGTGTNCGLRVPHQGGGKGFHLLPVPETLIRPPAPRADTAHRRGRRSYSGLPAMSVWMCCAIPRCLSTTGSVCDAKLLRSTSWPAPISYSKSCTVDW
jgi:hypothetical protein